MPSLCAPANVMALYREAFMVHGRREESLLWGKKKQAVRFAALARLVPDASATLLDYGCGLGDLAAWLKQHRPTLCYTGADALPEFIASNRAHLPGVRFLNIADPCELPETFDHIVCCGVFNLDSGKGRHWEYVKSMLSALLAKTRISLHVDFLAHDVDYRQDRAYHQDLRALLNFVERELSRRYWLDRSYMPYEYCLSIFARRAVDPDRNLYVMDPAGA